MILSINQPAYLPWLGYFNRIDAAQKHIELDHVQFEKNSFINRNKIKTKDGSIWLTVPVKTKGRFGNNTINQVEIDNTTNWQKKHLQSIYQNYKKTFYFDLYFPLLESIYKKKYSLLIDLINQSNNFFIVQLNIQTFIIKSSSLNITSSKSDLILDLCINEKATTYLSGPLGRNYLDKNKFIENNIEILYDDYKHPTYSQLYDKFEPYMCILDLLFNHGGQSLDIIKQGRNFNRS
jgi:hypothetical protein